MKPLLIVVAIAAALAGGWYLGRQQSAPATGSTTSTERKVLFYQSPMHPWIKSDQPGNCTICGMKLTPVYEGDAATSSAATGQVVQLTPQSLHVMRVETSTVTRQPLQRVIRVAGRIDDDDTAHRRLSAYVEGRVDHLFVNYLGAEVTAGQPLAALYSRELLVARGEYLQLIRQTAGPEKENSLTAIRQKLRRFGLTSEQIEKLPSHTGDTFDLVAPISGTIIERKVYPGQYVKEGDVLFEIADFSKMWFVFDAYERDLAWLRLGQPVEITGPSIPGKTLTAPVAFIDPTLVEATRSAKVRVVLDNPLVGDSGKTRRELLHKTFANGRIRTETEPVLTVPRSAVLSAGGEPLVYVEKGDRMYEPRSVTLGRAGDEVWEIVAGLQEGEKVVTTGNLLIDSQAQIEHPTQQLPSAASFTEPLTAGQENALGKFLTASAAVADALSKDDLAQHNEKVGALHEAAMAAAKDLGDRAKGLDSIAHVASSKDLTEARRQYYPVSMLAAKLAVSWRRQDPQKVPVKVFECPMAKTAIPSADTNQGRWVQLTGPLQNPFFGAEMLTCGAEVAP